MKKYQKCVFALLLAGSFSCFAGSDHTKTDNAKEKNISIALENALSKSMAKMLEIGFSVSNRRFVISKQKKFLVVSALPADPHVMGGRIHFVYDQESDSIIYMLGED